MEEAAGGGAMGGCASGHTCACGRGSERAEGGREGGEGGWREGMGERMEWRGREGGEGGAGRGSRAAAPSGHVAPHHGPPLLAACAEASLLSHAMPPVMPPTTACHSRSAKASKQSPRLAPRALLRLPASTRAEACGALPIRRRRRRPAAVPMLQHGAAHACGMSVLAFSMGVKIHSGGGCGPSSGEHLRCASHRWAINM